MRVLSANSICRKDTFENRLIALSPGTPNELTIVCDGNRVSKIVGTGTSGVTTKFLVDTNNPTGYAQVVEEVVGGTVQRGYCQLAHQPESIDQRCGNIVLQFRWFKKAFAGFALTVAAGGSFTNEIVVQEFTNDRSLDFLGTLGANQASTKSFVYLGAALSNASSRALQTKPPVNKLEDIITGIGVGLGRTAAHEFWHQIQIEASDNVPTFFKS